jgi:endonuclease III
VDVTATVGGDHVEGGPQHLRPDRERLVAVVGVDHDLDRPAVAPPRDVRVRNRMVVVGLPRHQPGVAGPPALGEVEPAVVAQRPVSVGGLGDVEELGDRGDIVGVHLALDLESPHRLTLPVRSRGMARPRSPKGRALETMRRLAEEYPEARCELDHADPYQLLVATILSAQSTDKGVNQVTPALFARYPTPADLAEADPTELEKLIHATGFFRNKAKSLMGMARAVVERFDGEIPSTMDDLVSLPGVGRKTANVILSVGFRLPGLPVDTHVTRLSQRLGLTTETDAVKIERELNAMLPAGEWGDFSLRMILHGRRVCLARAPRCEDCVLNDYCPSSRV